ncbi:1455_t:CDS:2 [Diversispora eburnea]|uniref:1455_t:CDS:1 n=1 Tax=Diversispora eburnea TaxID=1213867 RepID=A0A9N9FS45_9GLOM|nr:1455_t:CDS:2 [Diversispora eburnea]
MFWAYAGIARSTDNPPQWLGDPPHERWYSVYDSDIDTLNIFANHTKEISKIIN